MQQGRVVREIRTPRSVGTGGGRLPPVTRRATGNSRPYRDHRLCTAAFETMLLWEGVNSDRGPHRDHVRELLRIGVWTGVSPDTIPIPELANVALTP